MDRSNRRSLVAPIALLSLSLSGCATTSTLTVPRCAERVEIVGQHERRGANTLVFDHGFDPPWSFTEVVLERDGEQAMTVQIPHTRPDPGRLLAGLLTTALGGALTTTSLWQLQQGQTLNDEGPFYSLVFGGAAVVVGGFLSLTGWGPAAPTSLSSMCSDED